MLAQALADAAGLAALAAEVADQARALILTGSQDGRPQVADTKSSLTDVVTAMDRAVEDLLVKSLLAARPDDGVLGEERGFRPGTSGISWVLDPIDGTVNYLYGRPEYAISVAAVTGDPRVPGEWHSVAGCVLEPVTGHRWTASAGAGAWRNGVRLRLRPPPELSQALVGTGFGYRADRRAGQARVLGTLLPQVRDIRRAGCAALDLCAVASGGLDAYYERGTNAWDVAAARLIVTEAGGSFRGLLDSPPGPEMVVAGAPPLCDQLADLLTQLDAGTD